MYLNLFPLFVGAKNVTVFDEDGSVILETGKVKGYIKVSGLLNKRVDIRRLVVYSPIISSHREKIDEIIKHVKEYLAQEEKAALKVKISVFEVVRGTAYLVDNTLPGEIKLHDLTGEFVSGRKQELRASAKEVEIKKGGWPEFTFNIKTLMKFKHGAIEINDLEVESYGSLFKGEGFYGKGEGGLKTRMSLLVDTVKRFFGLSSQGDGKINAAGKIRLGKNSSFDPRNFNLNNIFVDLKLDGNFYIQALMELLKVDEKVEGYIDFKGSITGYLSDISGKAKAKLKNGNLFGVDVDSLACDVSYSDRVMKFQNGAASVYNGSAQAEALLNLPVVDFYTLNIRFQSVDSPALLKLIGWEPDIPVGKVAGELLTSGPRFNPEGWFKYKSESEINPRNVIDRIKNIEGLYSLEEKILTLSEMRLDTSLSHLEANGTVNLNNETLNLKTTLFTANVLDLTLPFYDRVQGKGNFSGELAGTFDSPGISGIANLTDVSIEGYPTEQAIMDISYKKDILAVHKALFQSAGEEHRVSGKIFFPRADELFDFRHPVYDLTASIKNADFSEVLQIFNIDIHADGKLDTEGAIKGEDKSVILKGKAYLKEISFYNVPLDSATTDFVYKDEKISLKKLAIEKGSSRIKAEANFSFDRSFSFNASSEKILIKDAGIDRMPDDAVVSFKAEGHGTFANPDIKLNARVIGGTFKGRDMGSGTITASIQNRQISLTGALFNERMKLAGKGYLDNTLPWSAELQIQPARYDFIMSALLKDVPEDLQLNVDGRIELKGDRKSIHASADINHMTLSLFEQTFSNDKVINIRLDNRKISFKTFTVKSGSTSFRLQGGLEVGKEYNIFLDGSAVLSPLKGLSREIGYLKGDADFVVSVSGSWNEPKINGGLNVSNASFGLSDYPTYISSINGYFYIDEDRVVIETLTGKIGGGDVKISGHIYLRAFDLKRFYLETKLDNITLMISKDFNVNFSGALVYKGTYDAQSITGDININRSRFRKMIEWRSWLITKRAKEVPRAEISVFQRAELNIRISGSDNIFIDNNIARAPVNIRGDMIVKGTLLNPVLVGRLEATEGYVYFRNNEFRIIYASADFVDPFRNRPIINLAAEAIVQGYNIRLNLEGEMDQFNLSLSSTPHLEEMDILALLTVGEVGKQLKGLEGGIGASEATSFLTGKAQDIIEERLRSITGLDRFQVEPYVSKTTGTVEPRVTVSERLIGDRLFVSYTASLGSTEEQIIKLEYLLDKNISLVGMRDERGSVGGDIKFRFEFK